MIDEILNFPFCGGKARGGRIEMDGMHIMIPQEEYMRLMEENEELREALKGAQIIAEQAKGHIAENAQLRAELLQKTQELARYQTAEAEGRLPVEFSGIIHKLKTVQPYYDASEQDIKTFEIRKNDRDFRCGDILHLMEWDGCQFTGKSHYKQAVYILADGPYVPTGFVCMAVKMVSMQQIYNSTHEAAAAALAEKGEKE